MRMNISNDHQSVMVVSYAKGRYKVCDAHKVKNGSFYTVGRSWLAPQVKEFILSLPCSTALDPFAGNGDLLKAVRDIGVKHIKGYDITGSKWEINDSLKNIPSHNDGFIITNPPFLAKHSAKRKGVLSKVDHYYRVSGRDDLYQVALDKCLAACKWIVAIVPETFINSNYPKEHVCSITILEDNPFSDTDCPVCVVCFDNERINKKEILVYRNEELLVNIGDYERMRLIPSFEVNIKFNDPDGPIALRAVDLIRSEDCIQFLPRNQIKYSAKNVKESSRLMTFITIPSLDDKLIPGVIANANKILDDFRRRTKDITLSPFKGNRKDGIRRRRLDYYTARAILESAVIAVSCRKHGQLQLF